MNEDLRSEIILNQMHKFDIPIDYNGQYSRFGLNSLHHDREYLERRELAFSVILNHYWTFLIESAGEHTASVLLQLWMSSKSDATQILTFLFISEMGLQGKARQEIWEQNPIYDNVKNELDIWFANALDEELARKLVRCAIDYYLNCSSINPEMQTQQLLQWIVYGNKLTFLDPRDAMTDEQVEIYNSLVSNAVGKRIGDMDDRFILRSNTEFNLWFNQNYSKDPEGDINEGTAMGIPFWAKAGLVGIFAYLIYKKRKE